MTSISPAENARRFLAPFRGGPASPPPIWLMRQAGRYLPEYRQVRNQAGGFLDLCYNPKLAAEVTLQPIRRFGFDAAILFSDILVVPDALGQTVRFLEGEGPVLDPIRTLAELAVLRPSATRSKFDSVAGTVQRVRADLPHETALIGFCGGPWTVATYMVEGRGSKDQMAARLWAYRDPAGFQQLIAMLVEASIDYLSRQVEAGADALQIFDTWAGSLAEDEFDAWVIRPTAAIVAALKVRFPSLPLIGFPKGAHGSTLRYIQQTRVDGVGCDTAMPLTMMRNLSATEATVIQGNLDPLLLVAGGEVMDARIDDILEAMAGQRFVFNLGHGIVPQTPPENVGRLVERVRARGGS